MLICFDVFFGIPKVFKKLEKTNVEKERVS